MPRKKSPEKSPIDEEDYEGLQVDTRPKAQKSPSASWKGDFHFLSEKEAKGGVHTVHHQRSLSQTSPGTAYGSWTAAYGSSTLSPNTPGLAKTISSKSAHTSLPLSKRDEQIGVLKRKRFWVIFGILIFIIVVLAAIAGGLAGGLYRKNKKTSAPNTTSNTTLPPVFSAAQRADVMIGSPLCVISYDLNGIDKAAEKRQEFRVYFQSLFGNVKEAVSSGGASWQTARPIFTDALNNTGLASFTYMNGTQQQGSLFYVGNNGLLQEKRKIYADNRNWEVGKLNNLNIPMTGNLTPAMENDDPRNGWDSYRIAAVYSRNFSTGPGARLYYHAQKMDGSSFVQEMIWLQTNDTWLQGATLPDANPNSHLAATVDDSVGVLRVFFSTGNRSLQEVWTTTGPKGGNYTKTYKVDNLLPANNADLAAVSANGSAYLYHYVSAAHTENYGIRELVIRGSPQSGLRQESYNMTEPLVTSPLMLGGNNASLYQPLAASITAVRDLSPQFLVLWADKPTGDPNTNNTGYQNLAQVSRPAKGDSWPSGTQLTIPLGSEDSEPH